MIPQRRRALRVLISTGPTREPIDEVRFLSNSSTGVMGTCLAQEAIRRGHRVTVVSGPSVVRLPEAARVIPVERSDDMEAALRRELTRADLLLMAAAVCDFRPASPAVGKLSRRDRLRLSLVATPDILGRLPRRVGQVVVGFALETEPGFSRMRRKLRDKRVDLLVGLWANGTGSPFGWRPVQACLLEADGRVAWRGTVSKTRLARVILDKAEGLWYGGRTLKRRGPDGAP